MRGGLKGRPRIQRALLGAPGVISMILTLGLREPQGLTLADSVPGVPNVSRLRAVILYKRHRIGNPWSLAPRNNFGVLRHRPRLSLPWSSFSPPHPRRPVAL